MKEAPVNKEQDLDSVDEVYFAKLTGVLQGFDVSPASARGINTSWLATIMTRSARSVQSNASSKVSWGYFDMSNSDNNTSPYTQKNVFVCWKRSNSAVR